MSVLVRLCVALVVGVPVAAEAQTQGQTPVAVRAGQSFVHANTGLSLPARLVGLPRTTVVDLETPQLDVMTSYATADSGEVLTVYIYRATAGAVPIWFDRAVWQIEHRPLYGTPGRREGAPTFVPPGQTEHAGMIAAWTTTGSAYRGTALALVPLGEWLMKFRYSSATHDATALTARLRDAISAIGWPRDVAQAPAAAPVLPCRTALTFSGPARPLEQDGDAAFQAAVLAGMTAAAQFRGRPRATWCSDPAPAGSGAIYRADGASDAYLLALSDAGRAILVGRDETASVLGTPTRPSWSVSLVLPGRTIAYPLLDRLPTPDDALALAEGPATVTTGTWGKKRQISINNDIVK